MTQPRGASFVLPLSIAFLAGGAWSAWMLSRWNDANSGAWNVRLYWGSGIRLCREELALRAAAIRRCAARTGKLPESLEALGDDLIPVTDWMSWATKSRYESEDRELYRLVGNYAEPIDEPWHPATWRSPAPQPSPRPSPDQDVFGLPILYRRGPQAGADPSWVLSSDPLPPEIEAYLAEHGGPPPPSPEPFALSSLFVRDRLDYLSRRDLHARTVPLVYLAGLAFIAVVGILAVKKWKGPGPSLLGGSAAVFAVTVSVVTATLGAGQTMCYAMARFSSDRVSRQERLDLLEKARSRGEVSEDVARRARDFIEKLP